VYYKALFMLACATSALATAASAQPTAQVEEVIVTAQKREERLQEVPLTVSAVTATALERAGISGTRELMQMTPGLNFVQTSFIPQTVIRGVGTRGVGPGDESTVPIYVDGVYVSLQHASAFELNNVERVEVVKGPQGTLFGRNAVGGAINVITKDPGRTFEGKVAVGYGSFDERTGELYLSGPLTDTLSANLSVAGSRDDGYIKDLGKGGYANPASSTSLRGKLLWAPTDNTEVKLVANYTWVIDASAMATHPVNGITVVRRTNPVSAFRGPSSPIPTGH
jgi:iron complex outermembrane receptor protein